MVSEGTRPPGQGRRHWITIGFALYSILLVLAAVSEVGGFGWFDWMVLSR